MLFKNKYNEVRCGWKILLVFLLSFILLTITSTIVGILIGVYFLVSKEGNLQISPEVVERYISGDVGILFSSILSNFIFIIPCIIIWKLFEKKKVRNMGLTNIRKGYKELVVGLVLGAVTISIVAIILLLIGSVEMVTPINKPNISASIIYGIILFIFVGFGEEILSRGYIMSVLKQTRNKWVVIIISSLIFAILHLSNNGISILAFINLFLVGALFGYMFMKSKNIWMAIGYHITWNYFQGYIWGFSVSGLDINGLYKIQNISNNIINGGEFGPEGGIIVTLITCVAFYFVYLYYKDCKFDEFIDIIDSKEIKINN